MQEITSKEEFNNVIKQIAVIDFFAIWCHPCSLLAETLKDVEKDFPNIKFYSLDVDKLRDIVIKYNIKSIPCLIIFKEGKEIGRIIGNLSYDVLKEKIKSILGEE